MHEDADRVLAERETELDAQLAELTKPPTELGTISFGKRIGEGTSMAVDRLAAVSTQEHLLAMLDDVRRARGRGDLRRLRGLRGADPRGTPRGAALGDPLHRPQLTGRPSSRHGTRLARGVPGSLVGGR